MYRRAGSRALRSRKRACCRRRRRAWLYVTRQSSRRVRNAPEVFVKAHDLALKLSAVYRIFSRPEETTTSVRTAGHTVPCGHGASNSTGDLAAGIWRQGRFSAEECIAAAWMNDSSSGRRWSGSRASVLPPWSIRCRDGGRRRMRHPAHGLAVQARAAPRQNSGCAGHLRRGRMICRAGEALRAPPVQLRCCTAGLTKPRPALQKESSQQEVSMSRLLGAILTGLLAVGIAQGHFPFILPDEAGASPRRSFSATRSPRTPT